MQLPVIQTEKCFDMPLVVRKVGIAKRCLSVLLLAAPCLVQAAYDPSDRFYLYAEGGYLFDSNILRLNTSLRPAQDYGYAGYSDTVRTTTVGGHYETTWSRQQFTLNGKFSDSHYQRFSGLDYHSWNAQAAWNWAFGTRWNGSITYGDSKDQSSIENAGSGIRDVLRDRNLDGRAIFSLTSRIGLELSAGRKTERRELQFTNDYNQYTYGVGLTTATEKGSVFGIRAQRSRITYVWLKQFIGSRATYDQNQLLLSARWPVTRKTTFTATGGWVKNEGNGLPSSSGGRNRIGSFEWNWDVDPKNNFNLSYGRQSDNPGNNTTPSVLANYAASWTYRPTVKTQISTRASESRRDYSNQTNRERTDLYNLTLSWKPMTQLEFSTFGQRVRFHGTTQSNDYKLNQYGVNARVFY